MKNNTNHYSLWAGLLLCTAVGASAVPVTFQVNMSYQISLGNFVPGNRVAARGSFNGWGTFDLVNDGTGVYTNTLDIAGSPTDTFDYKYWNNGNGTGDNWENAIGNRTFTLGSSAQTLPVKYFDDNWGTLPQPPVAITFQVDMSVQSTKGAFDSANDLVEARGSFQSPTGWSGEPNAFYLTNNGAGVYTNTYIISNTPASYDIQYKFFLATNGVDTDDKGYELQSAPNRSYTMPSSAATIPVAYFNNELPLTNLVTFQVDMEYVPYKEAITNVEARGSFQSPTAWTGGFSLTNDPVAANPYLYTGTYNTPHLPGTVEYFKFTYQNTNNSDVHWENDPNRSFTLVADAQTLPEVLFNNADTNVILAADTLVTLTVSMTNAQSYPGFTPQIIFNQTMGVAVNGDWIPWWGGTSWNIAPPAAFVLTNGTSGDWLYSQTVLVPKGNSLKLTYKFGIDDGANPIDNEAGFATNHVRYVRQLGNYTLPLDTFGTPVTEPPLGNVVVGTPSGGHIPVSWLGLPGAYLQTSTDVSNPAAWVSHPETAAYGSPSGIYSTNYPMSSGPLFFRVFKQGNP
jgi:hypothetical protein